MHADLTINPHQAGIGLRAPHYQALIAQPPAVGFMEVHSENFFGDGGQPLAYLERFRRDYAISTHGVGLSLGSADGLSAQHLDRLAALVARIEPILVSEHLCWIGVNGHYLNDLLPLPYTDEALDVVVRNVTQVQERLGRQILVENVSSYLQYQSSTMAEWQFVSEVASRSGCKVLLDVNNIYVNACNHGIDAQKFIDAIAPHSVGEIHLAGFQDTGELLIDTHGSAVCDEVWALYEYALARIGPVPTLIEWDTDIPPLPVLLAEADKANARLLNRATSAA